MAPDIAAGGLSPPLESRYRYKPLDTHRKCMRLLEIQPGASTDPLQLDLRENLDWHKVGRSYEALSYAWGSVDNAVSVSMGSTTTISVTKNLFQALLHLRQPHQTRTLWVDAICINQSDVAERSAQVAIMNLIFAGASCVIAWLGPKADDSDGALAALERVGSSKCINLINGTVALLRRDKSIYHGESFGSFSESESSAVQSLLDRPWFERLWIRQEVMSGNRILPQDVTVQVGDNSMSWGNFTAAIYCMCKGYVPIKTTKRLLLVYDLCFNNNYQLDSLRGSIRGTKCQDPRDRIFSMLSLRSWSDSKLDISPDYSIPVEDVFKNIAKRYLDHFRTLDLLQSCTIGGNLLRLPSWVLDWSTDLPFTAPKPLNFYRDPFCAVTTYLAGDILRVSGVDCGSVDRKLGSTMNTKSLAYESIQAVSIELKIRLDPDQQYVSGGSLMEALCRIISKDRFRDSVQPTFPTLDRFDVVKSRIARLLETSEEASILPPKRSTSETFVSWHNLEGQQFFATQDGYLGVGPPEMMPGDRVCKFLGCTVPIVLRSMGNGKYRVVGSCYLQGMMFGEPILGKFPANIQPVICDRSDRHTDQQCRFKNLETGHTSLEDPRLHKLEIDLETAKKDWEQNQTSFIVVKPETLKNAGVDLQDFDLV